MKFSFWSDWWFLKWLDFFLQTYSTEKKAYLFLRFLWSFLRLGDSFQTSIALLRRQSELGIRIDLTELRSNSPGAIREKWPRCHTLAGLMEKSLTLNEKPNLVLQACANPSCLASPGPVFWMYFEIKVNVEMRCVGVWEAQLKWSLCTRLVISLVVRQ